MMTKPRGPLLLLALTLLLLAPPVAGQTTATADRTSTDVTATETTETTETTTEETTTEQTTTYYEDEDDNDREDAIACGICGGIGLLFFVLPLAISIAIAWWIYRDANRRGNPQAVLWAILGFFFNIIGLIIYLIARPTGPPAAPPPAAPPPPPPTV